MENKVISPGRGKNIMKNYILPVICNAYFALAVLLIFCLLLRPEFHKPAALMMIAGQVTFYGIIALGMTFVIAGGGIDLSVGSLFAFSGVVSVLCLDWIWDNPQILPEAFSTSGWGIFLIALLVSVLSGALGGALNGALIVVGRIPPFIATLGTLSIFRSLALYLADSGALRIQHSFSDIADPSIGKYKLVALVFVALTAVLAFVMNRTAFGRHVCAVGASEKVARYAGVRVKTVQFMVYVITGICVGIAAALFLGKMKGVAVDAGNLYELDAIAAVVIGGTAMSGGKGSLWGTLAGSLILGIIFALLSFSSIPNTLQFLVKGVIILISVFIQRIGTYSKDN